MKSLKSRFIAGVVILILVMITILIYFNLINCISVNTTYEVESKKPIYYVDTDEKKIAFSFDAAWGAEKTKSIMDVMEENGCKTTFFVVRFWVEDYPEMAKEIVERGHELENHSTTHPHLNSLTKDQIIKEIENCSNLIYETTGRKPTLFRPPFGEYNNTVVETIEGIGYKVIQWTNDSLDWKDLSADEIVNRIYGNIQNGSIVLFHNNGKNTVEAIKILVPKLIADGYEIVPVGELVYHDNYIIDNNSGAQKQVSKMEK